MNWSLSVQRELPKGIFGEATYISNLGRKLLRQPDINAPTFEALRANNALPAAQRLSVNALRPFKGYSQINARLSDANSSYHALQLYAAKRKGDLTLTGSYTWSKALSDATGGGNGDGVDVGEDPFNRRSNYGPTSFDRRHIFVATYTYRLPFLRGHRGFIGGALGGWELSGITRFQTGQYLTVIGNTSIGNRRADYIGRRVELPGFLQRPERWFNTDAFDPAPDTRRGNSGAGIVVGPGRHLWDLSLRKRFRITEGTGLQFQADFFNAFNMTNLNNPNVTVTDQAFGTIGGAAPSRNIQLGLKLTF
jgi:hypothetical protein